MYTWLHELLIHAAWFTLKLNLHANIDKDITFITTNAAPSVFAVADKESEQSDTTI